jgi:type IV secretory pathway VirD2 relaxase
MIFTSGWVGSGAGGPLPMHLGYLRRDGVTKQGEPARMFGGEGQDCDSRAFTERSAGERHHLYQQRLGLAA